MAFDLNDLAGVVAGIVQPWQVLLPYAVWPLTPAAGVNIIGMDGINNTTGGGAVYDPTLKRIYFSAVGMDTATSDSSLNNPSGQYSDLPVIYVFGVQ
jgi:hypothetical protein